MRNVIWLAGLMTVAGAAVAQPAKPAPLAKAVPAGVPYAAAFTAAGFARRGKEWIGCEGGSTADIAEDGVRDLNKDGVPEVIITEYGSACYGNTGQGFHVMTPAPGGKWRKVIASSGIPEFLKTGSGGWPDIEIGGPGFCFPVLRWNGREYALLRKQAKSAGGCNY